MTSVARGGSASRLNFLSATVCVDLAEQILHAERPRAGRKILIVSPYRPHARLVNLLLEQTGLRNKTSPEEDEVVSGTAHSFQGSEADVVILDLVVDEPHWRANLFVPDASEDIRRLLNVALTRARRRLLIVADFDYCASHGKKAFLGRELIPLLLARYPRVEATQILPNGLAARAAKAHLETLGGDVEPKESRLVVTQEHFYRLLYADIARAKRRVVIYSPFLTSARIETLQVHFRAAFERGVTLYVVTKPHHERKKSELQACREAEAILQEIGVKLIHKEGMHEKLVFLDNGILWGGSLNPLSHSRTQEVIERRASESVVADYAKTLRLTELLAAFENEPQRCPICGSEILASEGGDGDPFYWRCSVDGCYSRGVDDPPLQYGMIVFACGELPEFGWWGESPIWICGDLKKYSHSGKVKKSHLPDRSSRLSGFDLLAVCDSSPRPSPRTRRRGRISFALFALLRGDSFSRSSRGSRFISTAESRLNLPGASIRPGRRLRFPGRAGWRRCGFRRRVFQKHCPDVSSRFFPPCSTTRRHRHCFCPGRPTVKLPLRAA